MAVNIDTVGMGARLKALRAQLGLSLQEVASRAGCTKSHVWEMETGRSVNPTLKTVIGLANALGTSLDYLAGISTGKPRVPANLSAAVSAVLAVAEAAYQRGKAEGA